MHKKLILAAAIGSACASLAIAAEPASPHTFTGNVTLASEYLYRGIAQTRGKPALQGGFDYAHASGFYAGLWGSNISWISDAISGASASLELDIYGGYKGAVGDIGYDIGVLTYNYPGTGKTLAGTQELKQDTTEIYGALSWKWLTLKYSHSTTALFGWPKSPGALTDKTTGSDYLELNASYDMGGGWGINGHVGKQKVEGNSNASYSDYKVGVTKDMGFGTFGLAYSDTNAKDSCTGTAATTASDVYCYVNSNGSSAYSSGKGRLVVTFSKTF
ncbi:MAG: TorF family putative porin [Candidatus Nitricoxidivorans perseverans]|uniref:TorF family putative porin n=1 Tax=Candidatus Nitricoxidivorans perseverans TaxID=2975601 RepID=A0AA49FJP3_9PROT|nr:MAG: TorF family putative porin [Candidatus Nitricoxidivorans perseverans]